MTNVSPSRPSTVGELIKNLRDMAERERPDTNDYEVMIEVLENCNNFHPKRTKIPLNSRCWSGKDKTLSFQVDLRTPEEKADYYEELNRRYPNED